jgi:shikimate kinase
MAPSHHVILVGFMGTGKTTVGRLLAHCLHRPFIDIDDQLVATTGMSIPDLFAQRGEEAFRHLERAALLDTLQSPTPSVISCGGGIVTVPENRDTLLHAGTVICLTATPETILDRIGTDTNRPLLAAPNRADRIRELLLSREQAYAPFPTKIPTDALSPEAIVEQILRHLA